MTEEPISPKTASFNNQQVTREPLLSFVISIDGRSETTSSAMIFDIASILGRQAIVIPCAGLGQAVAINGMLLSFIHRMQTVVDGKPMKMTDLVALNKKINRRTVVRGLWIEDDILLSPRQAREIANVIKYAEDARCKTPGCLHKDDNGDRVPGCTAECHKCPNGLNIVTPYSTGNAMTLRDEPVFCFSCGQQEFPQNWVYFKLPKKREDGQIETGRAFTLAEIKALKPYEAIEGLAGLGIYIGDVFLDYVWYEGTFNGYNHIGMPSYSGIDWNYYLDNQIHLHHYPIIVLHEKAKFFSNYKALGLTEERPRDQPEHNWQKFYSIKENDIYCEVGPFNGSTALTLPKSAKKILIEASPQNITNIRKLMIDGDLVNTILIDRAISSKKGISDLKITPNDPGHHLLGLEFNPAQAVECKTVKVKTDTLENILDTMDLAWFSKPPLSFSEDPVYANDVIPVPEKLDHVDLLACDAEGAEYDLVNFAGKWLAEKRIHNLAIAAYHTKFGEERIAEILNKYGYETRVANGSVPYDSEPILYAWIK